MENKINFLKTNQETHIIDLGNGVTKYEDVNGVKHNFRSTIVTNRNVIERSEDTHIVNVDGVGCIIGAKDGKTFAGERRYSRSDYLYTLLTTICLAHCDIHNTSINTKVLLNLPLQLYQEDSYIEQLKKFEDIKNKKVNVDGVTYYVSIDTVIPLPEGLLLNTLEEEEVINKRNMFLDFGYGTLDIVISFGYEIELIKTIKNGVSLLYDAIAKKLNTTRENIEYYYNMPEQAIINCEVKDITPIKSTCLTEYADDIINILEDLAGGSLGGINKIHFQGGGSQVIYSDFKKYIKNKTELVEDAVYTNLRVFKTLAEQAEQVEEIEQASQEQSEEKNENVKETVDLQSELDEAKANRERIEEEIKNQQNLEEQRKLEEKERDEEERKSLAEKEAILKAQIEEEKEKMKKVEQENEKRKVQLEEKLKTEEEAKLKAEKEAEEMRKALEEKLKTEEEARKKKEKDAEEQKKREIAELEEKLKEAQEEKAKFEEEKRQLEEKEKEVAK